MEMVKQHLQRVPAFVMSVGGQASRAAEALKALDYGLLWLLCFGIGGWVVLNFVLGTLEELYNRTLRPGKNLKQFGKWAVVTGATDGIGEAMAMELAKKGLNIYLMSRTQSKLDATQAAIEAKYPKVQVKNMAVDFSRFGEDEDLMDKVRAAVETVDVGVLINNVGMSYDFCKYFHELRDDQVRDLTNLNVQSTTWMTRYVLPGMNTRKGGYIVNISSAAGVTTAPLLAQYGAVKSYIAMFSKALNAENKHVHVQCQVPLFVTTKLAKLRHTSLTVPSPAGYAKYAVAAIGYETVVSPYLTHSPYLWLLCNLPESLASTITGAMHQGIRTAGMKKEAKKAAESSKSK